MADDKMLGTDRGGGGGGPPAWNLGVQRRDRKLWSALRERLQADVAVLQLTLVELEEMLKQLLGVALPNPRIRGEVGVSRRVQTEQGGCVLTATAGRKSRRWSRPWRRCCR